MGDTSASEAVACEAGCLTGPNHSGVELHGFLSYLLKCNLSERQYTIFGYKGKQVRDNIHSLDVARFIEVFIDDPRCAEVYNLGGGRENSCSILEAFGLAEAVSDIPMVFEYDEKSREGDHICYISDLSKMKRHYPQWENHPVAHRHRQRDLREPGWKDPRSSCLRRHPPRISRRESALVSLRANSNRQV